MTGNSDNSNRSVRDCLAVLGLSPEDLQAAVAENDSSSSVLKKEFKLIRKAWIARALETHPDKGGDPAEFRAVQESFEVLRLLLQQAAIDSYLKEDADSKAKNNGTPHDDDAFASYPSWEYYKAAEEESDMPKYRIEPAKSGRSQCVKCKAQNTSKGDENNKKTGKTKVNVAKKTTSLVIETKIPQGSLRVGSLDELSGGYSRWHKLGCWRVPSRVWLGLNGLFAPKFVQKEGRKGHYESERTRNENDENDMELHTVLLALQRMEGVLLSGFAKLDPLQKIAVGEHVLNQEHHAILSKAHYEKIQAEETKIETIDMELQDHEAPPLQNFNSDVSVVAIPTNAVVVDLSQDDNVARLPNSDDNEATNAISVPGKQKPGFVIPRPGGNVTLQTMLSGKRFVLTGVFPEVGGGCGLSMGKEKVKAMIESFGGRVTSAVSGKTDALISGKEPGASKVGKARERKIPIIDLHELKKVCLGDTKLSLETSKPAAITSFSSGYKRNGIKALKMDPENGQENNSRNNGAEANEDDGGGKPRAKSSAAPAANASKKKRAKRKASPNDKKAKSNTKKAKSVNGNVVAETSSAASMDNLHALKHKELKELCKSKGLKVSGKKDELLGRLRESSSAAAAVAAVPNHVTQPSLDSLHTLKHKELKELCKSKGLKVSGKKDVLLDRLREYFQEGNGEETESKTASLSQY